MTKKPTLDNGIAELERKRKMHLDAAENITLNDDAAIQAHIRLAGVVDRLIGMASQHKGN